MHLSGVFSQTIVFRFKPAIEKTSFIELTSFKNFYKNFNLKFQAYFGTMPLFALKTFV